MKQLFNKKSHQKFIKYFGIKEKPSKIENDFYKKTEKYIKYIKYIPGLKMIGIGNSVSMNSASVNSDIDLFIITDKKRLWIVRIFITIVFQLLGVRKNRKNHASKFCLSFFTTTDGMNFQSFALEDDIYLYFWIIYLKPILNYDNTYQKFLEANERWCNFGWYENILSQNQKYIKYSNSNKNSFLKKLIKNIFNYPLDILEIILKKVFIKKSIKRYNSLGKPFGIIINDDILKFHDNDIRREIKKNLISK
ncbi:hypothetical protein CSB07_00480 [Candidatus Gracilibacteria bacterium]|nr:MAG: hypothetical protein CSB07_00480 [Candidatus Gracilibacteria bacterium]PIE85101.1 MAG: hypothetical protein CSA08_03585 [Candidatus Gracilibacteria bacterium]